MPLKVKKVEEQPKKQTTTPQKNTTANSTNSTAPKTSSASATPTLDGNGNGASKLTTSSNFDYENQSIFDDDVKKDGKSAMCDIQGNSFYRGKNDSDQNKKMLSKLNEIQTNCKRWNVTMDADGDGVKEVKTLAETIAESYDSVLDLYIQKQVEDMVDKYGTGTSHGGYLSDAALEELAMKGIRADSVGDNSNRVYSFTMIDLKDDIRQLIEKEVKTEEDKKKIWDAVYASDGTVMKDSNGKKGSIVFADCLVPDGYAQKCELHLSSILDKMGYDCISQADFEGREGEYTELLSKVEANINSGAYHELNKNQKAETISDTYGKVGSIRQALNTLWKHDTAGKGGGKFAHGLGDGSDAYVRDNFGDGSTAGAVEGEQTDASSDGRLQQSESLTPEEKAKAKANSETEESEESKDTVKTKNGDVISSRKLRDSLKAEYRRTSEDYLDAEGNLSAASKAKMLENLAKFIDSEFNVDMTDREIYDIIF